MFSEWKLCLGYEFLTKILKKKFHLFDDIRLCISCVKLTHKQRKRDFFLADDKSQPISRLHCNIKIVHNWYQKLSSAKLEVCKTMAKYWQRFEKVWLSNVIFFHFLCMFSMKEVKILLKYRLNKIYTHIYVCYISLYCCWCLYSSWENGGSTDEESGRLTCTFIVENPCAWLKFST